MAGKPNLHQLYPSMVDASAEIVSMKVDQLLSRYDREMRVLIDQYDRLIENPRADPAVIAKAIADKARLIKSASEDVSRVALMAHRQKSLALQKAKIESVNKSTAVKLLDHKRKVEKSNGLFYDHEIASRPPKVLMFEPGAPFVGTVRPKVQMEPPEL